MSTPSPPRVWRIVRDLEEEAERKRKYSRDWVARHPERARQVQVAYRERNADRIRESARIRAERRRRAQGVAPKAKGFNKRAYGRKYRDANQDELRAKKAAYREANRDRINAKKKQDAARQRDYLRAQAREFQERKAQLPAGGRRGEPWSPTEDRIVIASNLTMSEIAVMLDRSYRSVVNRRFVLNQSPEQATNRRRRAAQSQSRRRPRLTDRDRPPEWTAEEINVISRRDLTIEEMADEIGRSQGAVSSKRGRLGLPHKPRVRKAVQCYLNHGADVYRRDARGKGKCLECARIRDRARCRKRRKSSEPEAK